MSRLGNSLLYTFMVVLLVFLLLLCGFRFPWAIRQYRGVRIWFALRFNRPLNVKWLGAHGNYPEDDHDDTEAFRRAIAMVKSEGGTVLVPKGEYDTLRRGAGEGTP